MKILIIHLSDMHFINGTNYTKQNMDRIVSALNYMVNDDIKHILMVISGDLTYSGKKDEFNLVEKFIDDLEKSIAYRYNIKDIKYAIVPGNHDIDYVNGKRDRKRIGLETLDKDNSFDDEVKNELVKLDKFYDFAASKNCFLDSKLLHTKIVQYDGTRIRLNLINTAVFSSMDEDQGFHYLPQSDIDRIEVQDDCDYIISVMHHPHHWFNWRCKKDFENALYTRSDLIFVGHEHYESAIEVESSNSSVNIFAGGELCDKGDWSKSEFHAACLDTKSREYVSIMYRWNVREKIYEEMDKKIITLSKNRYNCLGLSIRPDYMKTLIEDKLLICSNIMDYFVFPLLEEECTKDDRASIPRSVDSMEAFLDTLNNDRKIIISGTNDSGKSILARAIYNRLAQRRITLFLNGSDITSNIERSLRQAFEDAYSSDSTDYERFKQIPANELAIVIDDVDLGEAYKRDEFFEYIGNRFGLIVETCLIDIDIDIRSRLKKRSNTRDFIIYRIAPFYANKRKELVTNVVQQVINKDSVAQQRIINMLCDVLTKQKYLYGWNPEFIVQFAKYYCNNIGEAAQNDGSVFSKVFEANLTQLIKPFVRNMTVDKVFMVMEKVAYGVYVEKCYPFRMTDINKWIDQYNNDYDSNVDSRAFVNLLIDARILKQVNDKYYFYDRNYLSYFTAREIKRRCLEDGDYSQFEHVMDYCYSGLNADILLFITYIVDNRAFIERVMERALKSVEEWDEFDLEKKDIKFLVAPISQIVKPYEEGDRERAEKSKIEQEKKEVQSMAIANDESIFFGEKEELDYVQKVIRSISLMIIISRTLPSFEHMMKKTDKEACVKLVYSMPLKIFQTLAKDINAVSGDLIKDIKCLYEAEFHNEKPNEIPELEDGMALYILKWEATSLLLDLMNAAIGSATRENTNEFLDRFPYRTKTIYGVEHLIGLARRDNVGQFSTEAERLYIPNKDSFANTLIQRIARNYMVNSKNIKTPDIQSINSKIFNQTISKQRILVERERNKRRDGVDNPRQ